MHLIWHGYNYFPYERELALREVRSLLQPDDVKETDGRLYVERPKNPANASRLVYFAGAKTTQHVKLTEQATLERVNGNGPNRQSTRYSVHGLHEYKGKFNPQIAKAILNIFGARPKQRALDPFCGSGTSLVECAHLGVHALGADINPMAVYLANAKLAALSIRAEELRNTLRAAVAFAKAQKRSINAKGARETYLASWFEPDMLQKVERMRVGIESADHHMAPILLAIVSNLLRDYSLQEPQDLRVRRRKSPMPTLPFFDAVERAGNAFCDRLGDAQATMGTIATSARAVHTEAQNLRRHVEGPFDLALTSPPYATALPYIDTQRLSLIWLGLAMPSKLLELEASLIGSREVRGDSRRGLLRQAERERCWLARERGSSMWTPAKSIDRTRRLPPPSGTWPALSVLRWNVRSIRGDS